MKVNSTVRSYPQWATSSLLRHNDSNPSIHTCQKNKLRDSSDRTSILLLLVFFLSFYFTDLQPDLSSPWAVAVVVHACWVRRVRRTVTAWVSMNLSGVFTGGSTSAGWWDGLVLACSIWPWWIRRGAVDGSYQNSSQLCVFRSACSSPPPPPPLPKHKLIESL